MSADWLDGERVEVVGKAVVVGRMRGGENDIDLVLKGSFQILLQSESAFRSHCNCRLSLREWILL